MLLAPLAALHTDDTPRLLPTDWDPALAGNIVMRSLIKATAPQVKGAHGAEFVSVGKQYGPKFFGMTWMPMGGCTFQRERSSTISTGHW